MSKAQLSNGQLTTLIRQTPFTSSEIKRLWSRFHSYKQDRAGTISSLDIKRIDELLYNPFAARISEIFSEDGSGRMSFKNFLEMFSVFSPRASFDVKVIFLFAIWDFDGDDVLGKKDIKQGLDLLLNDPKIPSAPPAAGEISVEVITKDTDMLSRPQIHEVLQRLAAESDPDGNGLTFQEFQSVVCHATDFGSNFRMSC